MCFEHLTQSSVRGFIFSLGKFSKHQKDLVKREITPLQLNLFHWPNGAGREKKIRNLLWAVHRAIQGTLSFVYQQQPAASCNSRRSCRKAMSFHFIFGKRRAERSGKAKQMTKYLTAFLSFRLFLPRTGFPHSLSLFLLALAQQWRCVFQRSQERLRVRG